MRKQKSNKLRIIHLLLLAALLLLTAKLIYAQVLGGDSMGRIEWTSMQLYRNGSNYDYSYNYALRLDAKSGQMLYDCSFKAPANLNDEIWRCELEIVPVTREELAPLDALSKNYRWHRPRILSRLRRIWLSAMRLMKFLM